VSRIVVVGASLAGLRAAETLRREGFGGQVTVAGAEDRLPYDRPPLSKQVLAGTWDVERTSLVDESGSADDLDVDWELGRTAVALDLGTREVILDDDRQLGFDGLVLATGSTVRTLPGTPDLPGVHTLRTLEDCLALRDEFTAGPNRVVVVGAGFIGAEVAATARGRGLEVTLLEALPVPLGRVLGEEMGSVCAAVHRDHGVDLRLGTGVDGFDGSDRVERVRLSDGSAVDADVVVVGIGVTPNTSWLEGSGLTVDNGVVCDETCRAAPGVVAAGDIARWPNRLFGEVMRLEHWDNAQGQGEHAARTLLADLDGRAAEPYAPVPWFWSDQYDRKLQLAGLSGPDDEVRVVEGSIDERAFVALYGRAGRLVGVLGMNRARGVVRYRQLIADGASWTAALDLAAAADSG
jgi:3-phenylpropionate/trans-cinnamate dioxygenase ferredoxin reductase subunit